MNLIGSLEQEKCWIGFPDVVAVDAELARTFMEIVRARSFVAAAEQLNVSQTAVSARVRTLEEQLGRPLFVRNKNGASLPPASLSERRCDCGSKWLCGIRFRWRFTSEQPR
jgi:molybdenum-dependent DNA-binding transcriptional regulator ModE